MAVCYLDADEEITGAVSRLRATGEGRVVMVVPSGSRVASGRINFRLLAREARERRRELAIVSPEPTVRALALSAGMAAYGSVEDATSADDADDGDGASVDAAPTPGERASPTPARSSPASEPRAVTEPRPRVSIVTAASRDRTYPKDSARDAEDEETARTRVTRPAGDTGVRRRRWGVLLAALLVLLLGGGAAAAALTLLPTASITLRPRSEAAAPLHLTVTADPDASVPDPAAGVVPAERVSIPLSVEDSFDATGVQMTQTAATGTVRFTSTNTFLDIPVPAGTTVSTAGGVTFVTTQDLTVPRAAFETGPTTRDVGIKATAAGPGGNVPSGSITQVSPQLAALLLTVTNPEPTSGGRRARSSVATPDDYTRAVTALTSRLDAMLPGAIAAAASAHGLTMYPESADRGRVTADPRASDVVGKRAATFSLTATATASVVGVNESQLTGFAAERLRASVPAGYQLFDDSIAVHASAGTVADGKVSYTVDVTAQQWQPPDRQSLVASIKGKKLSDARAILERYGTVQIRPWPDFVDTVPDQEARINLSILAPDRATP